MSIFQSATDKLNSVIAELREKAAEFMRVFRNLQNKQSVVDQTPHLQSDYNSLMKWGQRIIDTIKSILSDDDDAPTGLGFLPLIPVAAVLAAIAAITAWLTSAYEMSRKIDLAEQALQQGIDPTPIVTGGGVLSDARQITTEVTKVAPWLVGAFLVWKFAPEIKRYFKS